MISIMTELTTKGTRDVGSKITIVFFLTPVFIAPLVVPIPLVLVSPSRLVLLGVIPSLTWVVIVPVFSFIFAIIRLMDRICHIQLFKILILLNGKVLNKIHPSVRVSLWWNHGLWRTKKWKVWILWGNDP
jgi:hypothetical protein